MVDHIILKCKGIGTTPDASTTYGSLKATLPKWGWRQ